MHLLSDVITYVRRIVKSPSNVDISDALIIDYINRFWINDVDLRMQHFDLKKKYTFITTPGVDKYNMPLYSVQIEPGAQTIGMYPVYQGFLGPCSVDGVPIYFDTQQSTITSFYPNIVQNSFVAGVGVGNSGPYNLQIPQVSNTNPPVPNNPPYFSLLRGHIDIAGIISTGNNVDPPQISAAEMNVANPTFIQDIAVTSVDSAIYITAIAPDGSNVVIADSGQFLEGDVNYGLLMQPGKAPNGNLPLPGGYLISSTITGITQATQAVITANNTFQAGEVILITGVIGMTEINDNTYTVVSANATTVTINVDSTGFTAYVSGGVASSMRNLVNYLTGELINVFFPVSIPPGNNINIKYYYFQPGLPRVVSFYNNTLTFRSPPARQYRVDLTAYLTPAAFLSTSEAVPYGYMSEYIARGAARKILSDTGDIEQFQFYEPLFREQELLVWKRSQRIWTANRTETIYSNGSGYGCGNFSNFNGGSY